MINIFLCDDTPLQLQCIHDLVSEYTPGTETNIFAFESAGAFQDALDHAAPDIAVLDIDLGKDNGIDLARFINNKYPNCQIIFLTSYSEYVSEVYFTKHTWFVLKKDVQKYLPEAMKKAVDAIEKGVHAEPSIYVKNRRSIERVPLADIMYLERIGHRTKIVKLHDTQLCRQTPEELLSALDEDTFIHCHQSFWVNGSKIFSLVGDYFHLMDGTEILISRTYKQEAVAAFEKKIAKIP